MTPYQPEVYWSRVAQELARRGDSVVAGDDHPYFRYKRQKCLRRFMDTVDFRGKNVLEVGCGPGGNLRHIAEVHGPRQIFGADISAEMLELAARNLSGCNAQLVKMDGTTLPYADEQMDLCFTSTVLHHNDEKTLRSLAREMARVTKKTLFIMEDVGSWQSPTGEWIARPVETYRSAFEACGFHLAELSFLNTKMSRRWSQTVMKRLVSRHRREGEPIGRTAQLAIGLPMVATRVLDDMFPEQVDLAKMVFERGVPAGGRPVVS